MNINILTPEVLFKEIALIANKYSLSIMDSIVYYCEKNEFDIEVAATMVAKNKNMVASLQEEGERLRLLPRTARLPI